MARQKSILGLDIGTHCVKAVELSGSAEDGVAVTGLGCEKIPAPDMLEETIHAVIANNNLRARRVVTSVSGRSVIVRYVPMAAAEPDQLREAVRYEADKYIPFDLEEVQLDCQQLGPVDDSGDQVRVLLVAAKRQIIDEHIELLRSAGLTSVIIDVDMFALANAFEMCNQDAQLVAEGETVALVDVGAAKTNICIVRGNDIHFSRELYTAGDALTDAVARRFGEDPKEVERMKEDPGEALDSMREAMMEPLEELGNEIRLSFDFYENQFDQMVSRVYLSGGSVNFPGLVENIGQIVEVESMKFDPFGMLEIDADDESLLQERSSDLVVALGLASRLQGML